MRKTVAIEYRWVEGRNEPAEIVAEFVRLKVDTIVTYGTPSILAAKQATSVIPCIVGNRASSAEVAIGTRADALFVILDPPLERLESGNDILSFSDFR